MLVVVIDTNLMIAGRWKKDSSSNRIIEKVIACELDAVYTSETKNEAFYILEKIKAPTEYMDRILRFHQASRKVNPDRRINTCPDQSDNRFLEAAVAGKADYIISSDSDLLDMKEFEGIKIIKPGVFEKEINL